MIIFDTNLVSELMEEVPNERVLSWARMIPKAQWFTTAVTRAEIFFGVESHPEGKRTTRLRSAAEEIFSQFAAPVLPFDQTAADWYAQLRAHRRRLGRPVAAFDMQIAAIARVHGAAVATRNISDFTDCGIELIDPWQA
jgi:toxin FitB